MYQNLLDGDFSVLDGGDLKEMRQGRLGPMSSSMDASSGISKSRFSRIEKERMETLLGDAINFPYYAVQKGMAVPDLGDEFRENVETSVPALFISGTLDGRTPPDNAQLVSLGFDNATHLVIDGAGHSDPLFLSSPQIKGIMLSFMRGESVPDQVITLPPLNIFAPK